MGYVAVKGGVEAIENAEELLKYFRLKGGSKPIEVKQIQDQLRLAVDKVMGEGSLYAPYYAALALKQAEGDTIEASFILRAYRSTVPRNHYSLPVDTTEMHIIRRISAAFKDIPGGQVLGPTRDYTQRLLDFELAEEDEERAACFLAGFLEGLETGAPEGPVTFSKVIDLLREEGLVEEFQAKQQDKTGGREDSVMDITRETTTFPCPREGRLQAMARGEIGGMLAIAYSSMRGYGDIHPTLGELRVGYVPLKIPHPRGTGELYLGRVLVTEAEVIARFADEDGTPKFTVGYGLCFGHNELKAVSMAILDRTMSAVEPQMPAEDQEFVLSHIDGIESSGFAAHWKLPHYVTFQSDLDRLRSTQKRKGEKN
ncbi:MAG: carbon-phosphorus lyase complex subunit PhnI [Candidatus Aquicultor sp.]|nr:carbon-phosphorus lyase complex subunit PhnI [Candidatus Aquicultor sp.]